MYDIGTKVLIEDCHGLPKGTATVESVYGPIAGYDYATRCYTAIVRTWHDSSSVDVKIELANGKIVTVCIWASEIIGPAVFDKHAISHKLIQMYREDK